MLSPYTVLDLTDDRGELASMILGDLGADVIKIEPPEGSSSRRIGPFIEGAPEAERSLHYFAYNRNKRGVTLDLHTEEGSSALRSLVQRADFLFESAPPGAMAKLGLDFDALLQVNPLLVYVSITPYGQDGPYANYAANDLTLCAMGGQMALQGNPGRPPVRITVPQVWLHAASEAAVAALIAHALMLKTGKAQFVDVSAQTVMIWSMMNAMVAQAIHGRDFNRMGPVLQLGTISLPLCYECKDGYLVALSNGPVMEKMVPWFVEEGVVPAEWIDGEEWRTYDRRLIAGQPPLNYSLEEVQDALRRYFARHTKDELMERGLREGVTIAPVNTAADISRFRQLKERDYWLEAPLPNGIKARMPGFPARPSDAPMTVRRWAPRIGEHSEDVLGAGAATDRAAVVHTFAADGAEGKSLPFAGLKVVDFTWIAAGPTATKYLADHGATVVRVETENPPDLLRGAGPYKDGVPGTNRSQFYGEYNTSKLSTTLDVKNPEGLAVARRLIGWADLLAESFTPGTMDAFGLGYEVVRELNPSIIMASSCLMGQTGPAAAFAGYGYHAAGLAGFFEITGWPGLPPDGPWAAYTDVVSPRFFAATIMAALERRRRTGRGERIDLSQLEASLTFLAPQLIDYQTSGRVVTRAGNRSETAAPHAAYPCAGEDQWCAIAVENDEQWGALRRVIGDPEWARDERFAGATGRLASQDEIDARLGEWTRERSRYEVMRLLQAASVPAGVAQRSSDLLNDPQLAHRGFHRYMEHPEMGNVPYGGHEFRIRGYDSGPRFPAPLLGQHNEQVMREVLGMTEEEMMEVLAAGAIA
jgi:crotonobetainyl-CoA:carnitine CoA-transferase CaiB-like acyl-CoA transferase